MPPKKKVAVPRNPSTHKTATHKTATRKARKPIRSAGKPDAEKVIHTKLINTPEISSPPVHDVCYVWLLMKGDSYLPGIFVAVYSILRTNPEADLVVMVTPDVSETAQTTLLKVATHLFHVPYLSFKTGRLKTDKQNQLYKDWKSDAYTKWNMLALPYKKAVFLDGDTIATTNCDELFNVNTPAAPFNNPFVKPLGYIVDYLEGERGSDGYLLHEANVSQKVIHTILHKHGSLLTASAVILEPSFKDYDAYIKFVKSKEPYGHRTCHSMVDEQSIAEFYTVIKNVPWVNVHHRYNMIGWKNGFLSQGDIPKVIHYFSPAKPWNLRYNEWEDVNSWYQMAAESLSKTGLLPAAIKIKSENVDGSLNTPDTFIRKIAPNHIKSVVDIINHL